MKKRVKVVVCWLKSRVALIEPGQTAIKGAAIGLIVFTSLLVFLNSILVTYEIGDPWYLLFGLLTLPVATLIGFVGSWMTKEIAKIPRLYRIALIFALPLLFLLVFGEVLLILSLVAVFSLLGASWFSFNKKGFRRLTVPKKVIFCLGLFVGLVGFGVGIYFYAVTGLEVDPIENAAMLSVDKVDTIPGPSPAEPGTFTVKTITYGSGSDLHRPEFGKNVTYNFLTNPVNGVAFLDNWKGFSGWWRTRYWGFDYKTLPLNGRIWYPQGSGPFPLVLVVHGNHSMQDYSDPGYDYLGELLASNGMIVVSVDENFINSSWTDIFSGLEKENDARGWLLLEHLKLWHQWNMDVKHPFFKKIDTQQIALVGHSRGGEAVVHAAMLNDLDFYPDDATIALDYHFNINSLVAIAPVDGQYQPGEHKSELKDVSYFVIHGAQDADVSSFMGSAQYERITFEDTRYHFKAGLYIYGANHGQFNTSWGANDTGNPFLGLLNLKQQLDGKTQLEIAKVYISAFLKATLQGEKKYLPLFLDARKGRTWLPETIYLSQFEDSDHKILASFEEDFDVRTLSVKSGKAKATNLSVWRESEIQLKWDKKGSRAVFIGWDYELEDSLKEEKSKLHVPDSLIASYSLSFDSSVFKLDSTSVLRFAIAESKEDSNPKSSGKWVDNSDENTNDSIEKDSLDTMEESDKNELDNVDTPEEKKAEPPLDFTIQLVDSANQSITFLLSEFSPLQREIPITIWKTDFVKGKSQSEKIFQTFSFNLAKFAKLNPNFSLNKIKSVNLIFDQSSAGVIVVDNFGFGKDFQ